MDNQVTSPNEIKRIHIYVDGHVQGVGFRYFVYDYAQNAGLTGWVRNRYNGQVEITAEGEIIKLKGLLDHVHQGPGRSMVTDVKFDWSEAENNYQQFSLLATE